MNEVMEIVSERKYVTVLFSDISEYSRLAERLDPEDVLKISNHIFRQAVTIIHNYGGYIERVMGDAILAFFGVPATFEDAAVRAVRAALDIHRHVKELDGQILKISGHPIRMHSGISSGLVVTGKTDIARGKDAFAGRPINIASYLKNLSGPDEIFVAHDTYCQAEGFLDFEPLGLRKVKAPIEPIPTYKVLAAKKKPEKLRRISGLRAELIGRYNEIGKLQEAADQLNQAKKKIFCIVGDTGAGKSRLVQEFKSRIKTSEIQWLEGHAYAYRQDQPYFPFTNLLGSVLAIEEGDSLDTIKVKLKAGIRRHGNGDDELFTYIGMLYGMNAEAANSLSPEFIKSKIEISIDKIFKALAKRAPAIFCFEDIHWADKSSVDLLLKIAFSMNPPVMFILTQRPPTRGFDESPLKSDEQDVAIINLGNLSLPDVQRMLQSLLKSDDIPPQLNSFINQRVEGNPLFLEEIVNSLIESAALARSKDAWRIIGSIDTFSLPSSIHGIIAARFDKLEVTVKAILQEAAVIGKDFSPLLLEKISSHKDSIEYALKILQQYDFIQPRQVVSGVEYTLKHTLTHDVIYDSILLESRKGLHAQIAQVMETLYSDRIHDFCETLAYHFTRAGSVYKAVAYHLQSGQKAADKYALDEADRHYREAFQLIDNKTEKSPRDIHMLIDVLNQWGHVFYLLENNRELIELFLGREQMVASAVDKGRKAMYYSWLGLACRERERLDQAHRYLTTAVRLGEDSQNLKAVGYSCAWLSFALSDMGRFDDAIARSERALEISREVNSQTIYRESMYGLAKGYLFRGEWKKTVNIGKSLVAYGQEKSDSRALAGGYLFVGAGYVANNDLDEAIRALHQSINFSPGPTYRLFAKTFLGNCYISAGNLSEAQSILDEIINFGDQYGLEAAGEAAKGLSGIITIMKGQPAEGLKLLEAVTQNWLKSGNKYRYASGELALGKVYQQLIDGKSSGNVLRLIKNLGFIIKVMPFARKRAEQHFENAAKLAEEMSAKMLLGQAYLGLGELAGSRGDNIKGRQHILKAIRAFEQCEAENFLKQAKDALKIPG